MNSIIKQLQELGYLNTGDNRSMDIRNLNLLIDSGFLKLTFLSYERSKTNSYQWEKDGKIYGSLYKVTIFGKTYYGHWMPARTKKNIGMGFGMVTEENDYKFIDLHRVLCRVADLISLNKEGFSFLKDGNCNCRKCNGRGIIPAFMHYAKGICFDCAGSGIDNVVLKNYVQINVNKCKD